MAGLYPIIAVTGPRQSGKTTLLLNMFPEYRYVSLEFEGELLRALYVRVQNGDLVIFPDKIRDVAPCIYYAVHLGCHASVTSIIFIFLCSFDMRSD